MMELTLRGMLTDALNQVLVTPEFIDNPTISYQGGHYEVAGTVKCVGICREGNIFEVLDGSTVTDDDEVLGERTTIEV